MDDDGRAAISEISTPKRRWFRFSLRTLLLAVTCLVIWLGIEATRARRQREAVELIQTLGGTITYGYEVSEGDADVISTQAREVSWLHALLPDEFVSTVMRVQLVGGEVTDEAVAYLARLPDLQELSLQCPNVTDEGLKSLAGMSQLRSLDLFGANVSDEGMEHLECLAELEYLSLTRTRVGDDGLASLAKLAKLNHLMLDDTKVSDRGLRHLEELTSLKWLELGSTRITDAGLEHLSELENLQFLSLYNTCVTDAGLERLAGLKNLTALWLQQTQVSGRGVAELSGLKSLFLVRLCGCPLNDDCVPAIADLPGLEYVDFSDSSLSKEAVAELQRARPALRITPP